MSKIILRFGLCFIGLLPLPTISTEYSPLFSDLFNCKINKSKEIILYNEIKARQLEIQYKKEFWRPLLESEEEHHPEFFSSLEYGTLSLTPEGSSGSYVLYDEKGLPAFVIKPTDESVHCLNNPRRLACPFTERGYWPRKDIPPYDSAQREALCYEIARICDITSVTPITFLSIISHSSFYLFSERDIENKTTCEEKEKLCSVQRYLKGTISLRTLLERLLSQGLNEKEIENQFEQENFENLSLFLWIIYDSDSHPSNFRAYKITDNTTKNSYGIIKIDNSLSFPESHSSFPSFLNCFPNAMKPLSKKTQIQIENLPLEEIKESLFRFKLEKSLPALEKRLSVLKEISKRPLITYHDIGICLSELE